MGSRERSSAGDPCQADARSERRRTGRAAPAAAGDRFLAAIVGSSEDAIIGKDPDGIILTWNRGAEQIYGYRADEVIGRPASILVPPEFPDDLPRIMRRLHRGGGVVRYETVRMARDGRRLDVALTISPILDAAGRLIGASTVARDISIRKRAEAYDRLLARAGEVLTAPLHPDAALDRLAQLVADSVADYCLTYRGTEEAEVRRVGAAHSDRPRRSLLLEFERLHPLDLTGHPVRDTILRGRTVFVPDFGEEQEQAFARTEEHLQAIRALGPRSVVIVPLRTRGRTIGALAAGTVEGGRRRFEEADLARLLELADLAALAVDNAQLLEDSRMQVDRLEGAYGELEETIAELQRSRDELEASEERVRMALDAGKMGTWEWDLVDGSVHWSETLERIHGLEPGTFPGTYVGFQRDIHPDDRERVLGAVQRAADSSDSSSYRVKYRIVRPDGEVRWLSARGRILRNETGEPVRIMGVCQDTTSRRKDEARDRFLARAGRVLAGSRGYEETLRKVADLMVPDIADWCCVHLLEEGEIRSVAVAHSDPDRRASLEALVTRNPPRIDAETGTGAVIRTGAPLLIPEVTDETLRRLVGDEKERRLLRRIGLRSVILVALEARGQRFGSLTLAHTVSGRRFDNRDLALASELAERGSLAVDNARLLGESRMNARKLELERARLAQLFERAPAFMSVLRGPDHVFEMANPRYRELVAGRDLIGKPIREALPEVAGQGYFGLLDRVYRTGEPYMSTASPIELRPDPEAPPRELFLNFVYEPILEPDGSVSGVFVHGVDVTELVRARENAEAAVRSREELLAFVSHDLRQPIGLLGTVIHVLRELDLPEPERAAMLERALRASEQADRLIDDLMDVARSDLGRLELNPSLVRLPSMLEATVDAFREEAERAGVDLRSELPEDLPQVHVDEDRLQRVLSNLVTNAIRYTPQGGTVTLGARREEDAVVCLVADTGAGIAAEEQPKVFERYWQGEARSSVGMGLGLSIAKDIVEGHGGELWLDSEPGRGSVFYFRLPVPAEGHGAGVTGGPESGGSAANRADPPRGSPRASSRRRRR